MALPSSKRWVVKEYRKVGHAALFAMPETRSDRGPGDLIAPRIP